MKDSAAKVKKRKFAQGIFAGATQWEAARAAGYKGSEKTLQECASRLMKDPVVQKELELLNTLGRSKAIATRDEALQILTGHLRGGLDPFIDENGNIDIAQAREAGKLHLLESYQKTETTGETVYTASVKVKLHSVQGAVDRLAKLLGWNEPEKHEHTVNVRSMSDQELQAEAKRLGLIK